MWFALRQGISTNGVVNSRTVGVGLRLKQRDACPKIVTAALPAGKIVAPAGANVTAARGKGVSFAARKSGPTGSPAAPVVGVTDEVSSRASVAAVSSVMFPPLNVTEPDVLMVAPEKGTPRSR